jgi:hypothetical protein
MTASDSPLALIGTALGIYTSFLVWGFFQERVTSVDYVDDAGEKFRFNSVLVLNACQALGCVVSAFVAGKLLGVPPCPVPATKFIPVAFSNTIASPFGYAALQYLSFPMLIILKASKLLPIMLMVSAPGHSPHHRPPAHLRRRPPSSRAHVCIEHSVPPPAPPQAVNARAR